MSIVVRFNPTNVTTEKYDESLKRLKEAGQWPPDGLDYHVCSGRRVTSASAKSGTHGSSWRRSASG